MWCGNLLCRVDPQVFCVGHREEFVSGRSRFDDRHGDVMGKQIGRAMERFRRPGEADLVDPDRPMAFDSGIGCMGLGKPQGDGRRAFGMQAIAGPAAALDVRVVPIVKGFGGKHILLPLVGKPHGRHPAGAVTLAPFDHHLALRSVALGPEGGEEGCGVGQGIEGRGLEGIPTGFGGGAELERSGRAGRTAFDSFGDRLGGTDDRNGSAMPQTRASRNRGARWDVTSRATASTSCRRSRSFRHRSKGARRRRAHREGPGGRLCERRRPRLRVVLLGLAGRRPRRSRSNRLD